jgi:hypothetical protein
MYYTSTDREKLEAYNDQVVAGENYDGIKTVRWANVIEHYQGGQWAILKHPDHQLIDGEEDGPIANTIADFFPPI